VEGWLNASIKAASAAPSPITAMVLSRLVSPLTTLTDDLGTPSALASSAITAALALPLSGTALTLTRSTAVPSSLISMPSTASRPALGVTRTKRLSPEGPSL
jgi:hypothetical protein